MLQIVIYKVFKRVMRTRRDHQTRSWYCFVDIQRPCDTLFKYSFYYTPYILK